MRVLKSLALATAAATLALPATAENLALAIGVEDYDHLPDVVQGTNVMAAVELFSDLGFRVLTAPDPTAARQIDVLEAFSVAAPEADRMIVALSGNFMTDGQTTWFLREDSRALNLFNAPRNAIVVQSLLTILAEAPGEAILVLGTTAEREAFDDYTRLGIGPLDVPRGVTVIVGPSQTVDGLIETGLAEVGRDIRGIVDRDRRIQAFGYWPDQFVFVDRRSWDGQQSQARAQEGQIWNGARADNTIAAYRAYLDRYPNGRFAGDAREAIEELRNDPIRIARAGEEALRINADMRRRIQAQLNVLGHDTRGIDGVFGRGTRLAIGAWQRENGLPRTNYLTANQIRQIAAQASERREALDRAAWREAERLGSVQAYARYLEVHPRGQFARQAQDRIEAAAAAEAAAQNRAAQDRADWRRAQRDNTVQSYERYLDRNPRGEFANVARQRLRDAEQAESRFAADRSDWRRAERDGSVQAYEVYIAEHPRGQFVELARERVATLTNRAQDRADWRRAQQNGTAEAYGWYLNRHPRGEFAAEAQAQIDNANRQFSTAPDAQGNQRDENRTVTEPRFARQAEEALGLNVGTRRVLEMAMVAIGVDIGVPDGEFDSDARQGIRSYQRANGIEPTGYLTPETVEQLFRDGISVR